MLHPLLVYPRFMHLHGQTRLQVDVTIGLVLVDGGDMAWFFPGKKTIAAFNMLNPSDQVSTCFLEAKVRTSKRKGKRYDQVCMHGEGKYVIHDWILFISSAAASSWSWSKTRCWCYVNYCLSFNQLWRLHNVCVHHRSTGEIWIYIVYIYYIYSYIGFYIYINTVYECEFVFLHIEREMI